MEKQLKVVLSKKEPQNKHVLWLEQDSLHEISPKVFNNGDWENLKTVNVPEELLSKVGELNDNVKEFDEEIDNFSSDIASFRNSLITETQQRMAVDSSLGNRITSVTATANSNTTRLNTLETEISNVKNNVVPKAVADGIAKVVANAPEDLDTLKEVADYIASDKTKASEIETAVSNLQKQDTTHSNQIATIQTKLQSEIVVNNEQHATITAQGTRLTEVEHRTDEHDTLIAKVQDEKAPKVGYAPDLKVNFAKELVGRGEDTPQVIGKIRPTGEISIGDGNATIEKIKGNSVVWNQQIIGITKQTHSYAGLSISISEDGIISINGTANRNFVDPFVTSYGDGEQALKNTPLGSYVLDVKIINNPDNLNLNIYALNGRISFSKIDTPDKSYKKIGRCSSLNVSGGFGLANYGSVGTVFNNVRLKVSLYNLTQMFGEGNEPTTIEEFEARKPLGVTDDFNEGEIISYDGANALQSVGFNAWDEEWGLGEWDMLTGNPVSKENSIRCKNYIRVVEGGTYEVLNQSNTNCGVIFFDSAHQHVGHTVVIPTNRIVVIPSGVTHIKFFAAKYGTTYNNDICIHLVHSGYRNGEYKPYEEDTLQLPNIKAIKDKDGNSLFPYGLLSAGSAHDEITATKAIKRIGVLPLKDLQFSFTTDSTRYFYSSPIIYANYGTGMSNILICSHYQTKPWSGPDGFVMEYSGGRKPCIALWHTNVGGDRVNIIDDSVTDAAEFMTMLKEKDVMLYYELAEPIEVDLEEPLNLTYEAWDFGTEELHTDAKTTPLNADISYQFNAVDRIRENTTKTSDLEVRIAQLEAMLTQMAQVNNEA